MSEGTIEDTTPLTKEEKAEEQAQKNLSALDVLLRATPVRQTETIKIPKRQGLPADLELTVGSLSDRDFKEVSDQSEQPLNRRQRRSGANVQRETDGNLFLRLVVAKGVVNPDLGNAKLLDSQDCFTADQLVQKLLLPGEIARVAEIIMDLSGFNDNTVEFAKN